MVPDDNESVGLVAELPSPAPTHAEAMQGVVGVVEQVAAKMADAPDVDSKQDLMARHTAGTQRARTCRE
jgi:hypothetical protein